MAAGRQLKTAADDALPAWNVTRTFRLERSQIVPRSRPEVFAFFTEARNLERLTPGFLRFRILTPGPIAIRAGTLIDYQLRLYGVPLRWRTRIETFEPGTSFTDIQLAGPYRRWHHRHEFSDHPAGTLIRDIVQYELPLGILGVLSHPLLVQPSLRKIFDYRARVIDELFRTPEDPFTRLRGD